MEELSNRRAQTSVRIKELREKLREAEDLASDKACVYATGSFGRKEAGAHSDLDLFIVGRPNAQGASLLRGLDEICIKADLIKATRAMGIQDFSGDGLYLTHYSVSKLANSVGKQEDDVENTLTARLLLLLESSPLLGENVYEDVIKSVIKAYWRDYEDHREGFIPAFLVNDILRLWRTFCVNYEARTDRDSPEKKAKGKIKNFKLKHSRLLTCYSALLYLLAIYRRQEYVAPEDALEMVRMTPTERLEWIRGQDYLHVVRDKVSVLLEQYERFLQLTNVDESALIERFLNQETSRSYMDDSYNFGDAMFAALSSLDEGRFYRLMVV